MAGTFTGKALADGQVATTKGTLYTVPALTTAFIKLINFFNTNAATQTIILYVNTTGTSRVLARYVLAQNESAQFTVPTELNAGDLVEAVTTTTAAVDYFITGVEET